MSTNMLLQYLLEKTNVSNTNSKVNDDTRNEEVVRQLDDSNDPLLQIKIVDVKSNVQLDENNESVKELKNVIHHEGSELDRTETSLPTEKLLLGNDEIQNEQIHPVATWKSPCQLGRLETKSSVSVKDNVTILDDLASISALKRLWSKTCQPVKMVAKDMEDLDEIKANSKLGNGFCKSLTNEDSKPGYQSYHTNRMPVVREPLPNNSNARDAGLNSSSMKSKHSVKPCKVKVKRLNNLAHPYRLAQSDSFKVDKSPYSKCCVMEDTNSTVTNGVDRTVGLYNCVKFLENTTQSTLATPRGIVSKDNNGSIPVPIGTNSSQMSVERHIVNDNSIENDSKVNSNSDNTAYDRLYLNVPCKRTIIQDLPNIEEKFGDVNTDFISDYENDKDGQIEQGMKKKIDSYHNESDIIFEEDACLKPVHDTPANDTKRLGRPPVLGSYHCIVCPFMAKERRLVKQHQNTMHVNVPPCLQCNKRFKSWSFYLRHMAYIHGAERSSLFEINGGSNSTSNEILQTIHEPVQKPDLKLTCQVCGSVADSLRDLRQHHAVKHGKRFQCIICGFRVKSKSELKSHLLVHTDERPFKCTYPGCTFGGSKTKSDLTKHKRVHKKNVRKVDS